MGCHPFEEAVWTWWSVFDDVSAPAEPRVGNMGFVLIRSRMRLIRAGRDAARAFTTGCFQTHLTHDLRGLGEEEMAVSRLFPTEYSKNLRN